ncbi:MAG: hypothetical protein IK080_01740, partial [Clostridia bacterium]|nr:hypothetical protein [Clostridia bacterium]
RQAAQALSDVTHYTAVVAGPQMNDVSIKRVQMVPVTDTSALLVIVTSAGLVKEKVIQVPDGVGPDQLYGLSKILTERLSGYSLQDAREQLSGVSSDLSQHRQLMANVLGVIDAQLEGDQNVPLVVGGRSNLLHYPEYSDVEKARSFLAVLESREKLAPLLKNSGVEFTVRIGPENSLPEFSDCSVVTATYHVGNNTSGTLGIIGPTRMDYARVVSVMNYMGRAISDLLSGNKE